MTVRYGYTIVLKVCMVIICVVTVLYSYNVDLIVLCGDKRCSVLQVMKGLGKMADLVDEESQQVVGGLWGFMASGIGSVVAGFIGSTPVVIGMTVTSSVD